MKNLLILFLIATIMGCSKKEDLKITGFNLNVGVEFSLLNEKEEDLLNPNTPNHFELEKMKLYYKIGDNVVEVFDENMALPRNIGLNTETNPIQLGIGSYSGYEGMISEENGIKTGISIAYLALNSEETDTIKTQWESKEGKYFVNRKVWYNGELKSVEEPFIIIK